MERSAPGHDGRDARVARTQGDDGASGSEAQAARTLKLHRGAAPLVPAFAVDAPGRMTNFAAAMDAMDDLPLELLGEDEDEAESQLLQLLQRLRFTGGAEGFGFDLCDLALGGPPLVEDITPAAAPPAEAAVERGSAAAQPQVDRTAASLRGRFVKALVLDSLRAAAREGDHDALDGGAASGSTPPGGAP